MLVGVLNGFSHSHRVQVVWKLLRAVEAYDVRLALGGTVFADRSERTCQVPMRAVE